MTKAAIRRQKRNERIKKFLDNQKDDFTPEPIKRDFEDLDVLDKKLIQLLIENPGIKIPQLAEECKTSYQRIYERTHKEDFREILSKFSEESLNVLLNARLEAAQKITQIMRDGKDQDSLNASKIILYGTSTIFDKRYQDVNIRNQSVKVVYNMPNDFMPKFSPEQLDELRKAGKIAGGIENITEIDADENQ